MNGQGIEDAPAIPDEQAREAVATLFRVIRPEPRLRLGEAEAQTLAPLVARWLERGCTSADLARALLPGLLTPVHSTPAALRSRLERKLPPAPVPSCPATARCAECHDPVPRAGTCRSCTGFPVRTAAVGAGGTVTCGGVSRARDALRAARSVGPGFGSLLPTG